MSVARVLWPYALGLVRSSVLATAVMRGVARLIALAWG